MRAKNRSILLNSALLALTLGVIAWGIPFEGNWVVLARVLLALLAFAFWAAWFLTTPTAGLRKTNELLARFGTCYECDGLSFLPQFNLRDETLWVEVFFQNRFTQPCRANVFVVPMEGGSPGDADEAPVVVADIDCAGGGAGVVSQACRVGPHREGRLMIYDLYAATEFPQGRGEELTPEEGPRVTGPSNEALTGLRVAFGVLHGGFTGVTAAVRPRAGKSEVRLPENVRDPAEQDAAPCRRTLEEWDEWTAGNTAR